MITGAFAPLISMMSFRLLASATPKPTCTLYSPARANLTVMSRTPSVAVTVYSFTYAIPQADSFVAPSTVASASAEVMLPAASVAQTYKFLLTESAL